MSVALLFYRHMPGRVVAMWSARHERIVWLRNKLGSGGMVTQACKLHHRGSYHSVSHVFGDSGDSSIVVSKKFS